MPVGGATRAPVIDVHCHLTDAAFDADREAVIARAWACGLTDLITIGAGSGMEGNTAAVALAATQPHIFATVGLHPHDADRFQPEMISAFAAFFAQPRVVGVGEIGLDYHYDVADRAKQRLAFEAQLALAVEHQLPYVIHHREAIDDLFAILRGVPVPMRGMIHCFTGDRTFARRALDLGLYLSIPGVVTFRRTEALHDALQYIPHDRLLMETDAPYLAPVPHRGCRNEPSYIIQTAQRTAEILGLPLEILCQAARKNAETLFAL
ncbi:MAG: TatD family hydrolase [Deltaproteobacteria bacterium]|nr:TatD family hydrolase [Deltaproteobacteria bacterium]